MVGNVHLLFNKLFGEDVISDLLTSLSSDHFYRRYEIYFLRRDVSTYRLRKTAHILQGKLIPSAISYMKVRLGLISSPFEQSCSWCILNSSVGHWTYSFVVHNHMWERMSLLRVNSLRRRLEIRVSLSAGASGSSTEWGPGTGRWTRHTKHTMQLNHRRQQTCANNAILQYSRDQTGRAALKKSDNGVV